MRQGALPQAGNRMSAWQNLQMNASIVVGLAQRLEESDLALTCGQPLNLDFLGLTF